MYHAIFLWESINKIDVFITVQKFGEEHTFQYKIETDLETIEGTSDLSGRVVDVHFRNRIVIHVTAIPQENVNIMIAVLDAQHVGLDDLTMILEWEI